MNELADLFDELERQTAPDRKDTIEKCPFNWPGGKWKMADNILPLLPYRGGYCEPCGGSGVILLSRRPSKLEVFNDRFSGITDFYRVIRDTNLFNRLMDRLACTLHSREEWIWAKDSWRSVTDPVERAARWYYTVKYSFNGLGRNWGRSVSSRSVFAGLVAKKLDLFPAIHDRLRQVQIENQDIFDILNDYDAPDMVFYIDPPYIDAYPGTYEHELTKEDHAILIDRIMSLRAFVALSGHPNQLYDSFKWDNVHTWEVNETMAPTKACETNHKVADRTTRLKRQERLWIKESD